jgi:hypothetical protein
MGDELTGRVVPPDRQSMPADHTLFQGRRRLLIPDRHGDPMESMGNLFDVAVLIGVGFMIMALSSFGLRELLQSKDLTIVKDPGGPNMEIVTRQAGKITRLKASDAEAQGQGKAIGTVYQLDNGDVIWVPKAELP